MADETNTAASPVVEPAPEAAPAAEAKKREKEKPVASPIFPTAGDRTTDPDRRPRMPKPPEKAGVGIASGALHVRNRQRVPFTLNIPPDTKVGAYDALKSSRVRMHRSIALEDGTEGLQEFEKELAAALTWAPGEVLDVPEAVMGLPEAKRALALGYLEKVQPVSAQKDQTERAPRR